MVLGMYRIASDVLQLLLKVPTATDNANMQETRWMHGPSSMLISLACRLCQRLEEPAYFTNKAAEVIPLIQLIHVRPQAL